MKTQFNVGDKVRLINDHSYTGIITKTTYVPKKGLTDVLLYLDGNSHPSGFTSDEFELVIEKEKLDREQAIEWWNKLSFSQRQILFNSQGFDAIPSLTACDELSSRIIEQFWRKEIHNPSVILDDDILNSAKYEEIQQIEDTDCCFPKNRKPQDSFKEYLNSIPDELICTDDDMQMMPKEEKHQVDFERLSLTLNHFLNNEEILKYYAQSELFNLGLFLELLSKSSSFAHKAHKELNKLNNK